MKDNGVDLVIHLESLYSKNKKNNFEEIQAGNHKIRCFVHISCCFHTAC